MIWECQKWEREELWNVENGKEKNCGMLKMGM